jgi:hypothetical protein
MNEDDRPKTTQHDVRRARQVASVKSITEPQTPQHLAHRQLRRGVPLPDGRHLTASFGGRLAHYTSLCLMR